jgi:very-short-patch-repair endonuclease
MRKPVSAPEEQFAFQLRLHGLNAHREVRFHPTRRWRFDFAFPDEKIAVEVEGGTWVNGAHSRGKHFESDCEKYGEAAVLGWTVLRVTPDMIGDGRAAGLLKRLIQSKTS